MLARSGRRAAEVGRLACFCASVGRCNDASAKQASCCRNGIQGNIRRGPNGGLMPGMVGWRNATVYSCGASVPERDPAYPVGRMRAKIPRCNLGSVKVSGTFCDLTRFLTPLRSDGGNQCLRRFVLGLPARLSCRSSFSVIRSTHLCRASHSRLVPSRIVAETGPSPLGRAGRAELGGLHGKSHPGSGPCSTSFSQRKGF